MNKASEHANNTMSGEPATTGLTVVPAVRSVKRGWSNTFVNASQQRGAFRVKLIICHLRVFTPTCRFGQPKSAFENWLLIMVGELQDFIVRDYQHVDGGLAF